MAKSYVFFTNLIIMEIWFNEKLKTEKFCQVLVDDRRLIRGNRIMLNIINTGDEEVVLPAQTLVAFAKVSMTSFWGEQGCKANKM